MSLDSNQLLCSFLVFCFDLLFPVARSSYSHMVVCRPCSVTPNFLSVRCLNHVQSCLLLQWFHWFWYFFVRTWCNGIDLWLLSFHQLICFCDFSFVCGISECSSLKQSFPTQSRIHSEDYKVSQKWIKVLGWIVWFLNENPLFNGKSSIWR